MRQGAPSNPVSWARFELPTLIFETISKVTSFGVFFGAGACEASAKQDIRKQEESKFQELCCQGSQAGKIVNFCKLTPEGAEARNIRRVCGSVVASVSHLCVGGLVRPR